MRPFKAVGRECPRAVESEERRVGRLRPRSVLAGALAERGRIAFDVEDVVDDLKRKADLGRIAIHGGDKIVGRASHDRAAHSGGANQRAGLARVHAAQAVGVERQRVARRLTRGLQVDRLSADHAGWPRSASDQPEHAQFSPEGFRIVQRGRGREQREGFCVQTIAGENRDAVAVDHVQRRPASSQRVVVHRRQIVVNQRVGVNQLDRAGGGQGEAERIGISVGAGTGIGIGTGTAEAVPYARLAYARLAYARLAYARLPYARLPCARLPCARVPCARDGIRGRKRKDRPQSLAAGEHAVTHRVADDGGARRRRRQNACERFIDLDACAIQESSERFGGHGTIKGVGDPRRQTRRARASARRAR